MRRSCSMALSSWIARAWTRSAKQSARSCVNTSHVASRSISRVLGRHTILSRRSKRRGHSTAKRHRRSVPSYLYGLILDRNAHLIPAHIPGIDGSTLRVIHCGELAALVSTVDRVTSRPSIDQVRAHDHALQAAVHHGATTV